MYKKLLRKYECCVEQRNECWKENDRVVNNNRIALNDKIKAEDELK